MYAATKWVVMLGCAAAVVAGCHRDAPRAVASGPGAAAPSAPSAAATATAQGASAPPSAVSPVAAAPTGVRARILGAWQLQLESNDLRQLQLIRAAMRVPPAPAEEIAALHLTAEERQNFTGMQQLATQAGGTPQARDVREMLEGIENAGLTITPDHVTLAVRSRHEARPYTVVSETADALTVAMPGDGGLERSTIRVIDANTLEVTEEGKSERARFTRRTAP